MYCNVGVGLNEMRLKKKYCLVIRKTLSRKAGKGDFYA